MVIVPLSICGRPLSGKGKRWDRCCAWSDAVICPALGSTVWSRMSQKGHEDAFPLRRLTARSVIRKRTVAAARGNGRDAPKPVIPATATKPPGSTEAAALPFAARETSAACPVRGGAGATVRLDHPLFEHNGNLPQITVQSL